MLENIDQTLNYYRNLANRVGGFPAKLLAHRIDEPPEMPPMLGLPDDYISFVEAFQVENVSLGLFDLMPFQGDEISTALELANGDIKNPLISDKFLHVASYESDFILLNKGAHRHDDSRVYFLDISRGYISNPTLIAKTFMNFILSTANLDKCMIENQDVSWESMIKIIQFFNPSLSEKAKRCWRFIFETSL